ncbi:ABC transporter permease subunit [Hydrogenophaga sp.]|uniref:ABC transporter permease n=1 Tax=Hydrogenophaga sp. TaxID=1904254 RepID=UPI00286DDC2A|nr:ABC transporter permease subunit [Hydrogenophaga sp.]
MDLFEMLGFSEQGWGSALLLATLLTVALTLCGLLVGSVFGALIAAAKLSPRRSLRSVGELYSTVFRGIPELLVIYLFYFGGSTLITAVGQWFGAEGFIATPPFLVGALAVGMISGSYQAEVYRGAYLAVAQGELEAARSIGMPTLMLARRILMPQIFRLSLPGLGNVWQMSLKDSALISVTGLAELMRTTQIAAGSTRQYFVFYIVGGLLYLVLTGMSNQVFSRAEKHMGKSQRRNLAGGH